MHTPPINMLNTASYGFVFAEIIENNLISAEPMTPKNSVDTINQSEISAKKFN
jgi:hypothetical protein